MLKSSLLKKLRVNMMRTENESLSVNPSMSQFVEPVENSSLYQEKQESIEQDPLSIDRTAFGAKCCNGHPLYLISEGYAYCIAPRWSEYDIKETYSLWKLSKPELDITSWNGAWIYARDGKSKIDAWVYDTPKDNGDVLTKMDILRQVVKEERAYREFLRKSMFGGISDD